MTPVVKSKNVYLLDQTTLSKFSHLLIYVLRLSEHGWHLHVSLPLSSVKKTPPFEVKKSQKLGHILYISSTRVTQETYCTFYDAPNVNLTQKNSLKVKTHPLRHMWNLSTSNLDSLRHY